MRDRALPALVAGFLVVVGIVVATLWLLTAQIRLMERVEHTLEVDQLMGETLQIMLDAETGQRGYLATLDPVFLEPYSDAGTRLRENIAMLREKVSDNSAQVARVDQLARATDDRMIRIAEVMADSRVSDAARQSGMRQGKRMMDDIRAQIVTMRAQERVSLSRHQSEARRVTRLLVGGLTVSALALLLLAFITVQRLSSQIRKLGAGRDALDASNRQLRAEAASREAAENQTRQLQKMEAVGQLTGGIAHDFNNMLAIVIGSLDLARRRLDKQDVARAGVGIDNALEGAQRASQLTARLMAFARQQPLEPVTVDANKLVAGMSELLRRTLGETVQVETVLAGGLWQCFVDPHQLENALVNLCVNGRDAMPDGGKLTIETANAELDDRYAALQDEVAAGHYVLMSVTDTGTGMPPAVIERAFDPFYTTKEVGRGTGLGLSQVHGFVKQSRGHIKIYSEPGDGTTIKLYLPRAHNGAAPTVATTSLAPSAIDPLPHARDDEIILVVEDDERVRNTTVDSLRELGYTVVQAADARQALAILAVQPRVDLLFTDVVMPDMNGRQLAEAVGARWPDLDILFTTGYTRNAIVHNGMLDPGVTLLSKPFTFAQLAYKIRQMLDRPH